MAALEYVDLYTTIPIDNEDWTGFQLSPDSDILESQCNHHFWFNTSNIQRLLFASAFGIFFFSFFLISNGVVSCCLLLGLTVSHTISNAQR